MRPRLLIVAVFGVAGTLVLASLAFWQWGRHLEKSAFISEIEARAAADPIPLPADPSEDEDAFRSVILEGEVGEGRLHLLTSLRGFGPGFRVIAPVETRGRRVLVDLGYIPEARKAEDFGLTGEGALIGGTLFWPSAPDAMVPAPDLDANIWFQRDLAAMASALDAEPLMIVAGAHDLGDWPRAQALGTDIFNRHLEYVGTWGLLAVVWAVGTVFLYRSQARRRPA